MVRILDLTDVKSFIIIVCKLGFIILCVVYKLCLIFPSISCFCASFLVSYNKDIIMLAFLNRYVLTAV